MPDQKAFPWRSYACVLAAAVSCYAALGAVLRIVPSYVPHTLHGGAFEVGLAVGAPAITGAILRPLGGHWSDRVGSRPIVLIGAVVMAAGVLPALLSSYPALLVSRLVVGGAEALMMAATVLWLLRLAGPEHRGRSMGHIGLANYGGLTIGPLLVQAFGGEQHPGRVWVLAVVAPLVGGAVALAAATAPKPTTSRADQDATWRMVLRTGRPGIGLLLVNIGYVAVLSFGATVVVAHGAKIGGAIIPLFAVGVIVSRVGFGSLPDKLGPARVLAVSALVEAVGLCVFATAHGDALVIVALVVLSLGQGLAVPSLAVLAISGVPEDQHGAAAGAFFAWFDGGVGLGGPLVGAVARISSPQWAVVASGIAVAVALPVVLPGRGHPRGAFARRRRAREVCAG